MVCKKKGSNHVLLNEIFENIVLTVSMFCLHLVQWGQQSADLF